MDQELKEQWYNEFQTADLDRIRELISKDSDLVHVPVKYVQKNGREREFSPLFVASNSLQDLERVKALVEAGVSLKNGGANGTPWPSGDYAINAYFIEKGVDIDQPSYLGFHAMGVSGLDTFFLMMENGMNPNYAWPHNGETLLHVTAREDTDAHLAKAYTLIKAGADINAVTLSGLDDEPIMDNEHFVRYGKETPLHFAARLGSIQMARLLVAHGADKTVKTVSRMVEPQEFEDWTGAIFPPGFFIGKNPRRMVFEAYEGETPKEMAIRNGHLEIAELL